MNNKENAKEEEIFNYLKINPEYESKNNLESNLFGNSPRLKIKFDQTSEGAVEK